MPATYSLKIEGLEELRDSLSKIPKGLATGIGLAAANLETSLRFDLTTMYHISESRFNNALIGSRTRSTIARGKNVIESGIEFRQIYTDLAKFPYTWQMGNIPPLPKKHQGKVHSVSIRRGTVKVVYGKYNHGGFTIPNGQYGTQMFERIGKGRYPLHILFGPSILNLVDWNTKRPETLPSCSKALNGMTQLIADNLNL